MANGQGWIIDIGILSLDMSVNVKEEDISFGQERICVELINEISDERPCEHKFQYIPSCIGGPGVELNFSTSYYPGCRCNQECYSREQCECIARYGRVYDSKCRLVSTNSDEGYCQPLFECNSCCKCPTTCPNRVVQKGLCTKLQIFKTLTKGWGVRTLENIEKNRFVCEYAGEIITYKEAKRRTQDLSGTSGHYIMVLREHQAENQVLRTHVDGQFCGNVARFMNHSCSPNLFMTSVRVNSIIPRLALFAASDIPKGEELCFDYAGNPGFTRETQIDTEDGYEFTEFTEYEIIKTQCFCGTSNCRGYLPFDSKLFSIENDS